MVMVSRTCFKIVVRRRERWRENFDFQSIESSYGTQLPASIDLASHERNARRQNCVAAATMMSMAGSTTATPAVPQRAKPEDAALHITVSDLKLNLFFHIERP